MLLMELLIKYLKLLKMMVCLISQVLLFHLMLTIGLKQMQVLLDKMWLI